MNVYQRLVLRSLAAILTILIRHQVESHGHTYGYSSVVDDINAMLGRSS